MDDDPVRQRSEPQPRDRFAVVAAIVFPSIVTWFYFVFMDGRDSALQQGSFLIGKCLQFAFPAFWVFMVLHRPIQRPTVSARNLAIGAGFGAVVTLIGYATFILVLQPAGLFDAAQPQIQAKVTGLGVASVSHYLALAAFYAVCHSLLEEYYWRWFVFDQLESQMRLSAAIVVSSLGFAAHHVIVLAQFFGWSSPTTYVFSLAVAIGGAFWAWLYHHSRSLLAPWLSHLVIDAGIFLIGYQLITL
jgi:CAAX protease family protein